MIDLKDYGYTYIDVILPEGLTPGRITELQREQYTVITKHGEVTAMVKGAFYHKAKTRTDFPTVGDFILLQYNESGASMIVDLLPRRTKFSRADFSGHGVNYVKTIIEQVVATNFDYVFILSSLNQDFSVGRIQRYLTQAWQSGGEPVIILTKADLTDNFSKQLDEVRKAAPIVPVHVVSSHEGFGLDTLADYLQPGKTVVFLGMSGVGKSSLLNALMEQDVMTVSAIREDDSRGRHTTTHRQLFMLPSGAMVIDTPGMRELGLFDADAGIHTGFADVEDLFSQCKFNDCRHMTEPGCAVLTALADGSLQQERWELYLAQKKENKFAEDKSAYLREARTSSKANTKQYRKHKKNGSFQKL